MDNNSLQLLGYADDHSLIHGFTPGQDTLIISKQLLETSLNIRKDWTYMNNLKMNDSKAEVIVFGTRSLLDKSALISTCTGQSEIHKSSCTKFLSTYLDDILSFKDHIRTKARTAYYIPHLIHNISKFITMEVTPMLTCTLYFSTSRSCQLHLGALPQNNCNWLKTHQPDWCFIGQHSIKPNHYSRNDIGYQSSK